MKFDCQEISIIDNEAGCGISFSDRKTESNAVNYNSLDELFQSLGQYVLLQRAYSDEEGIEDHYCFETSNSVKDSSDLREFNIDLHRTKFIMTCGNDLFEINLNIDAMEFENVKAILERITFSRGRLKLHAD